MQIQQQDIVNLVKVDARSAQKEISIAVLYVKLIQWRVLTTINKSICHGVLQIAFLGNIKSLVITVADLVMLPALFAILLLSIAKSVKMYQEYLISTFQTSAY